MNSSNDSVLSKVDSVLPKANGIMFLDWDDTFFPTTYFLKYKMQIFAHEPTDDEIIELQKCFDAIINFLEIANKENILIFIVTNAKCEWINFTMDRFYPLLMHHEQFAKINIISARDKYEHEHPKNPGYWKHYTFRDILAENNTINNIISIGDSDYERISTRTLRNESHYANMNIKTIKMIDNPTEINHLCEQIKYVVTILQQNIQNQNNDDVVLTVKYSFDETTIGSYVEPKKSYVDVDSYDDDYSFDFKITLSTTDSDDNNTDDYVYDYKSFFSRAINMNNTLDSTDSTFDNTNSTDSNSNKTNDTTDSTDSTDSIDVEFNKEIANILQSNETSSTEATPFLKPDVHSGFGSTNTDYNDHVSINIGTINNDVDVDIVIDIENSMSSVKELALNNCSCTKIYNYVKKGSYILIFAFLCSIIVYAFACSYIYQ